MTPKRKANYSRRRIHLHYDLCMSTQLKDDEKLSRLPRGHAYIRMRNRGHMIHIDYPGVDSDQAARMIDAVLAVQRADLEKFKQEHIQDRSEYSV